MGAIQQAFNQGLYSISIAAGPVIREQHAINTAQSEAIKAAKTVQSSEYTTIDPKTKTVGTHVAGASEVPGTPGLTDEAITAAKINIQRGLETAKTAYRLNPSKQNLNRLIDMRTELATFRSAQAVDSRKSQYQDQSANVKKVKQMQDTVRQARYTIKKPGGAE